MRAEPPASGAVERNDKKLGTLERVKVTSMFTGRTIEELINSVERAEQHAREQERDSSALPAYWMARTEQQEMVEVA